MSNDPNVSPQQPAPGAEPKPTGDPNENMLGMLAHLLGWIGALVVFLMKKDTGGFAYGEAKEALNFQITAMIAFFPLMILSCIPYIGLLFSLVLMALAIAIIVFVIMGAVSAYGGTPYKYPVNLRLIK